MKNSLREVQQRRFSSQWCLFFFFFLIFHLVVKDAIGVIILSDSLSAKIERRDSITLGPDFMFDSLREKIEDGFELDSAGKKSVTFLIRFESSTNEIIYIPGVGMITTKPYGGDIPVEYLLSQEEILKRHYIISNQIQLLHNGSIHEYASTLLLPAYGDHVHKARICAYYPENYDIFDAYFTQMLLYYHNPALGPEGSPYEGYAEILDRLIPPDCSDTFSYLPNPAKCVSKAKKEYYYGESLIEAEGNTPKSSFFFYPTCINNISSSLNQFSKPVSKFIMEKSACQRIRLFGHFYSESDLKPDALNPEEILENVFGAGHKVDITINGESVSHADVQSIGLYNILLQYRAVYNHPELDIEAIGSTDAGLVDTLSFLQYFSNGLFNKEFDPLSPKDYLEYTTLPHRISTAHNLQNSKKLETKSIHSKGGEHHMTNSNVTLYETIYKVYSLYYQLISRALYTNSIFVKTTEDELKRLLRELQKLVYHIPMNTESIFVGRNQELKTSSEDREIHSYNNLNTLLSQAAAEEALSFGSIQCIPIDNGKSVWSGTLNLTTNKITSGDRNNKKVCILEGPEQAERFGRRVLPGPHVAAISTSFYPFFGKSVFDIPEAVAIESTGDPALFACLDGYIPARDVIHTENLFYCKEKDGSYQIEGHIEFHCVPDLPTCTLEEFLFDVTSTNLSEDQQNSLDNIFVDRIYYEGEYLETVAIDSIWNGYNARKSRFLKLPNEEHYYIIPPQCRRQVSPENKGITTVKWFYNHSFEENASKEIKTLHSYAFHKTIESLLNILMQSKDHFLTDIASMSNDSITALFNDATIDTLKNPDITNIRYGYCPVKVTCNGGIGYTTLLQTKCNQEMSSLAIEGCALPTSSELISSLQCGSLILDSTDSVRMVSETGDTISLLFEVTSKSRGICPDKMVMNPILFPFSPSTSSKEIKYQMVCRKNSYRWAIVAEDTSFTGGTKKIYNFIRPSSTPLCVDEQYSFQSKVLPSSTPPLPDDHSLITKQSTDIGDTLTKLKDNITYYDTTRIKQFHPTLVGTIGDVMDYLTKKSLAFTIGNPTFMRYNSWFTLKIMKNQIGRHPRTFKISPILTLSSNLQESDLDTFVRDVDKDPKFSQLQHKRKAQQGDMNALQYYVGPYSQNLNMEKGGIIMSDGFRFANGIYVNTAEFLQFYPSESYDIIENKYHFDISQLQIRYAKAYCSVETLYPHHIPLEERLKWTDIRYTYDTEIFTTELPSHGLPIGGFMTIQPKKFVYMTDVESDSNLNMYNYRLHSEGVDLLGTKISFVCLPNGMLNVPYTRIPYVKRYSNMEVDDVGISNEYKLPPTIPPISDNISVKDFNLQNTIDGCFTTNGAMIIHQDSHYHKIPIRNTYYRSLQTAQSLEQKVQNPLLHIYCRPFLPLTTYVDSTMRLLSPHGITFPLSTIHCIYPSFDQIEGGHNSFSIDPLDTHTITKDTFVLGASSKYGNIVPAIATSFSYNRAIHGDGAMLRCTSEGWSIVSSGFKRVISPIFLHNLIDSSSPYHTEYMKNISNRMRLEVHDRGLDGVKPESSFSNILHSKHSSMYLYDILTIIPRRSTVIPISSQNNLKIDILETKTIPPTQYILNQFNEYDITNAVPYSRNTILAPTFMFLPYDRHSDIEYITTIIIGLYTLKKAPSTRVNLEESKFISYDNISTLATAPDEDKLIVLAQALPSPADATQLEMYKDSGIPFTAKTTTITGVFMRLNVIYRENYANFGGSLNSHSHRHRIHQENNYPEGKTHLSPYPDQDKYPFTCSIGQLDRARLGSLRRKEAENLDKYDYFTQFSPGYVSQSDSSFVAAILIGAEETEYRTSQRIRTSINIPSTPAITSYFQNSVHFPTCSIKNGFIQREDYEVKERGKYSRYICSMFFPNLTTDTDVTIIADWYTLNPLVMQDTQSITRPHQSSSDTMCYQTYDKVELNLLPGSGTTDERSDQIGGVYDPTMILRKLPRIFLQHATVNDNSTENKDTMILSYIPVTSKKGAAEGAIVKKLDIYFHTSSSYNYQPSPETPRSTRSSLSLIYSRNPKTLKFKYFLYDEYTGLSGLLLDIPDDNDNSAKLVVDIESMQITPVCFSHITHHYSLSATYSRSTAYLLDTKSYNTNPPTMNQFIDDNTIRCNDDYLLQYSSGMKCDAKSKSIKTICFHAGFVDIESNVSGEETLEKNLNVIYTSNSLPISQSQTSSLKKYSPPIFRFYNAKTYHYIKTDLARMDKDGLERPRYIHPEVDQKTIRYIIHRPTPGSYIAIVQQLFYHYVNGVCNTDNIQTPPFTIPDITVKQLEFELMQHVNEELDTDIFTVKDRVILRRTMNKICHDLTDTLYPRVDGISPILPQDEKPNQCDMSTIVNVLLMYSAETVGHLTQKAEHCVFLLENRDFITISPDLESLFYMISYSHPTSHILLDEYMYRFYPSNHKVHPDDKDIVLLPHSTLHLNFNLPLQQISSSLPTLIEPIASITSLQTDLSKYQKRSIPPFGDIYDDFIYYFGDPGICDAILPDPMITSFSNFQIDSVERGNNARNNVKENKEMELYNIDNMTDVGNGRKGKIVDLNLNTSKYPLNWCLPIPKGTIVPFHFLFDQTHIDAYLFKYVSHPQLKAVNKYYNTPSAAFPNSNKAFGELSVKIQDRDDYDINSSIYELDSIIYDKDKYILTVNVKVNDSEYFTKSPYAIYFEERFETGNTIPPPKLHPHLWVTDVGTTFASLPAIKTYLKPLLSTKSLRHIDQYTETYESLLSYIPQKPYNFCVTCDYNENIPDNHEYTLLYLYSSLSFHSLTPQSVTNVNQSSNTFERESIRQLSSMQYDTKFATPQELSIEIMIVEQGINSTATHSSAKSLIELVQANVFSLDDGSIVCDDEHDTPLLLQDLENKTCNLRVRITSDMIQRLSNLYISEDHYLLYLLVQLWTAESKLTQVLLLPYQPTSYGLQSVTASVYDPLVIEEIIKSTPKPMITSSTPYIIKTNPLVSDISTNQPFSYLGIHTEYKKNINDDLGLGPGFDGGSAESDNPGKSQVFVISDRSTMKISIRGISSDKTAKPKIQLQFEDKYKKMMDQNSVLESLFVWKEGLTLSATSTSSTPSQYQPLSTPIDCKYTRTTEKIDIFHHQCDILITAVDQNSNNILPYDDILEGTLLARIEFVKGNNIEYTNWELITIVILPPPKPTLQFLDLGFSRLHEMDEEEYLKQILLPTVNHQHNSEDNLLRNPEWNQLRMNLQITDTTTTQKLQAYTSDYILITAGKPLFIADENVEEGTNSIVTHSVSTLYISDEPVPISSATTTTLFEVTPTGHRSITALGLSKPLTNLFFTKQTLSHVVGVDVVEVNGEDKNIVKYIPNTFLLHLHPCKRVILYIHVMTKSGSMAVSQYIFDPSALKTEMFSNLDVGVVESILNLRKDFCQHDQLAQDYIDTPSAVLTNDVSIRALLLHSLDSINMVSMMYNLSYQRYPFLSSQLQEPTTALQKTELQLYESNLFLILQSVISSMQQIDLVRDYIIAKYGSIGIAILEPTNSYILLRLRECVVGINTLVTTLQEKNFEHTIARFEQYQQDEMIRLSLEYQQAMQNLQSVFIYKNTEQNMAIYSSRTSTFISTVRLWVAGYYETLRSKQRTESIQLLTTSLKTVTDALTVNDDIPMNIIERSIHVIDSAAGIVETIAQDLENKKDQTTQDEDTLDDIVVETRSLLQSTEIMMNSMSPILFYIAPTQDKDSTSTDNDDDTNDGTADDDNDNTPIPQDGIIKTLPNTRYNSKQIDTSNFVTTFAYVPKRSASIEGNSNLQSRHGEHMNFSFSIKSQGFMRKKHQNMLSPLTNFNNDDNQQTQSDLAIQIPFTILDDVTRTEPAIISYSVFKSKQLSKYAIDGKQTEESEQKNPLIQDSALNFTTTTTNNDYSSITPLKPSVSNIVNLSLLSGITGSIIPSSPPSITPTSNSLWYFIEVPISVPSNHEINPASSCVYIQSMKELIDNSQTETSSFKDDNSCQLHLTTATSIICRCTHLTYFSSRFSTQAFVPRFQRISITDIRSISWDNLTRNPTPIIILIVWPILTIIFVFIGSRVDRRLYRQGFVKLLQDWDPATQKPYTKIDVYKITKPTSILNHLWRRYLYTIRDSHLWLSVFYRQTTHNYSSQSRALAVMIVLLSSFTLSGLLFGYTSQGFIIVIVITSVCIAAINEIFRFLYDRTDQDKLKRYVYYYAESLLHFYFTGKSNLFPKEMHEKLMQDRPAIFSDSKSAQLEEIVLSLGWEAIPIWHIVDHKNRDVPKKYEGTIFDKNLVKKYASTAANVDNFYYRPRDYETKIDATEARRLHSIVRHKLPKECLDIELIHKFFFNRSTSELIPSNSRILVVVFMIIWIAACYFLVLTNATVLATSGATSATLSLTRDWVTSAGTSLLLNIFVISFVFGLIKNMIFYFGKLLMLKCVSKYFKGRSSNNSTNINNSAANTDEITNYKYQQSSPTSKKLVDIANNTTESLYTQAMPSICTFRRFSFVSEINDVEMADLKQSLKLKDMKDCDSMPQQPLDARVIDARNNDHSNDGDDDDDRRDDDSIGDNNVFSVQQHKTSPEELYQYIKNGSVLPSTKTSDVAHVFFADDNTSNTSTN